MLSLMKGEEQFMPMADDTFWHLPAPRKCYSTQLHTTVISCLRPDYKQRHTIELLLLLLLLLAIKLGLEDWEQAYGSADHKLEDLPEFMRYELHASEQFAIGEKVLMDGNWLKRKSKKRRTGSQSTLVESNSPQTGLPTAQATPEKQRTTHQVRHDDSPKSPMPGAWTSDPVPAQSSNPTDSSETAPEDNDPSLPIEPQSDSDDASDSNYEPDSDEKSNSGDEFNNEDDSDSEGDGGDGDAHPENPTVTIQTLQQTAEPATSMRRNSELWATASWREHQALDHPSEQQLAYDRLLQTANENGQYEDDREVNTDSEKEVEEEEDASDDQKNIDPDLFGEEEEAPAEELDVFAEERDNAQGQHVTDEEGPQELADVGEGFLGFFYW